MVLRRYLVGKVLLLTNRDKILASIRKYTIFHIRFDEMLPNQLLKIVLLIFYAKAAWFVLVGKT